MSVAISAAWARQALPVLESTRTELTQMLKRGDKIRNADLVNRILQDPLLAAQVLRFINQRERSALAAEVMSVDGALMLMGVNAFADRLMSLPTVESILLPAHPQRYLQVLREIHTARVTAKIARELGVLRYDAHVDELFMSGLISRSHELIRLLDVAGNSPSVLPLPDVLHAWKMPTQLVGLLSTPHEMSAREVLNQAAITLGTHLGLGWWTGSVQQALSQAASAVGGHVQEVWQSVVRVLLQSARKDKLAAQVWPAARWLTMLPGEWPQPQKKSDAEIVSRPSVEKIKSRVAIMQQSALAGASFNQIMQQAVDTLTQGVALPKVVFWLLVAGENALKPRHVVGYPADATIHGLKVSLETPHLLTKLMLKPQSIRINQENRKQFEGLLPADLRAELTSLDACAMSLYVGDKPVGLLLAVGSTETGMPTPISDEQYNAFKQICGVTSRYLTEKASRLQSGQS